MRPRKTDRRIFFPWEARGSLRRFFGVGRVRLAIIVGGLIAAVVLVGMRERNKSGVRQTRAVLLEVRSGVDEYMAKNDGGCPASIAAVMEEGRLTQPPVDAWGGPLRLICPSRHGTAPYELMSDGPDGIPGGLDRIE
jgi:general secretion pathway protein G